MRCFFSASFAWRQACSSAFLAAFSSSRFCRSACLRARSASLVRQRLGVHFVLLDRLRGDRLHGSG